MTAITETSTTERNCPRCKQPAGQDLEFCKRCGAKIGDHRHVPWWHVHRRLYDWTLAWAYKPSAAVALFVMAFVESSCFPIPPDVLLMPLVLGNTRRWLRYATICTLGSLLGGMAGFGIGMFLWVQVGNFFERHVPGFEPDKIALVDGQSVQGHLDRSALAVKGVTSVEAAYPLTYDGGKGRLAREQVKEVSVNPFSRVGKLYEQYDFWIVFIAAFTPIPYKVITITAGVFKISFMLFIIASFIGRAGRFYMVAGMMRLFGPRITPFIDKYFNWLALLFTALLIGGFVAIKHLS
ncbi:MAG: YqaA family protein [Phycisphaerae bacterium]